ncbi:MAG: mycofactocin biosynthesis chaperone MftB [Acidimicrobiales bacterium]
MSTDDSGPASSAEAATPTGVVSSGRWRLHEQVALRPEPFGALAYHYGNRKLNFVRSPDLVRVLEQLGNHPDVATALDECAIEPGRRPTFVRALTALAGSEFIEPVPA